MPTAVGAWRRGTQDAAAPTDPADPGGLLLHWLVAVPWMMVHEVVAFVVDYLRCRPWFFLPMAGPAILGLLLALYITAWLRVVPESDVMAVLDEHVVKARADRDWARARLGLQAILERTPDSQPHQFAFAQLLREGGDIRSAAAMLARLAPLDRVGYPPAHLLLAEETIARSAIIRDFEAKLQLSPGDARVSIVLAQAYAGQSRWAEARKVLAAVSEGSNVQAARAALCVDEFDASYASPVAPFANPDLPPTRETAAFGLLRQALQAVPNYPPAVQRFRSTLLNESPAVAQGVQDYVTGLLAEGEQPAVMHYLLGVRAYALQRWGDAIHHLDQAQRLRPFDVTVQYQLTRALLVGPPSDETLRRSTALIQAAIQRWPNHPELLATRGEVRLRQGDLAGAVSDLEQAISRLPSHAASHRLLAEAYQRLGNPQLSKRHRELAAQDEKAKPQGGAENAN